MNEGDLVAHIKSTDIDMQQDNLESQLKIYQTQLCLLYTSYIGSTGSAPERWPLRFFHSASNS